MNVRHGGALLVAALGALTACGSKTEPAGSGASSSSGRSGDSTFASATYSGCTLFTDGGGILIGYLEGSSLTLTASGSSVTGSFAMERDSFPVGSVGLTATSATSATLGAAGQPFAGEWGSCGAGAVLLDSGAYAVSSPLPAAATIELTSANAVSVNGVAFLSLTGTVDNVDGGPGCKADPPQTGPLDVMAMCLQDPGGSGGIAAVPATAANGAGFVPGDYQCYGESERVTPHESAGGNSSGTLVLGRSGSSLTATYSADWVAGSTLTFTPTSDTTAVGASGPLASLGCQADTAADGALPVIGAALTANGTTLFLGLTVDAGSGACPGQTSTTMLVCTPSSP